MCDPEDIKEYFEHEEWNGMSAAEKALFTDFAITIDVFNTKAVDDVKQEPIEYTETNNATTSGVSDDKFEAGDYKISCEQRSPENIIGVCDEEIKSENSGYEYCETCGESYQGVCTKCHVDCESCEKICLGVCSDCPVVTYILNNSLQRRTEDALYKALPKNILENKMSPTGGICALLTIPGGITFGPCGGLELAPQGGDYKWKLKGGKFVNAENSEDSNWMQFVNCAQSTADRNLNIFQYEDRLYYRSSRQIDKGEELLVYYGEEHTENIGTESESYYYPPLGRHIGDVYVCTFCCLGFGSETHLNQHRTNCEQAKISNCCVEEIIQCKYCNIYLDKGEYLKFHENCCPKKYSRNAISSTVTGPSSVEEAPSSGDIESGAGRPRRSRRLGGAVQPNAPIECKSVGSKKSKRPKTTGPAFTKRDEAPRKVARADTTPFKCEICDERFTLKTTLKKHILIHTGEKPFACHQCDYRSNRKTTLNRHAQIHTDEKPFACHQCDFSSKRKSSLKRHMHSHKAVKPYKCEVCDKYFTQKQQLKSHILNHTGEKPFACHQCDYRSNRKGGLRQHVNIHKDVTPYRCEMCDKYFPSKRHLDVHTAIHASEKGFACEQCDFKTTCKKSLDKHVEIHTGLKRFKCAICDECFIAKRSLISHIKIHNEKPLASNRSKRKNHPLSHMKIHTGGQSFTCRQCDYRSNRKNNLIEHMKIHTGEKPFSCHQCDYRSNRKENLQAHIRTHTGEKNIACHVCGFRCNRKDKLVSHVRTHTGEKPFACHQCDYRTNRKDSLILHIRTHTGAKPFACHQCDYTSNTKSKLVTHVKIHTVEKAFACDQCDYRGSCKDNLISHVKIHTGEKPFACHQCDYRSKRKNNLISHIRTHTGEKAFACEQCDYRSNHRSCLIAHTKIHTGEKPFACEQCDYRSNRKANLISHMQIHTSEKR